MKTISLGAEAKIILQDGIIIKQRIPKPYRLKQIDNKLIKYRTRREARLLKRLQPIIPVPEILEVSEPEGRIQMSYIKGDKLSEHLDNYSNEKRIKLCKQIGKQVALMHNENIIHGDLTTSNMILKDDKVYFIDFGLGFIDPKIEHKAVDLHLIKQALESRHYQHYESSFSELIKSYKKYCKNSEEILERLEKVESRGRYKKRVCKPKIFTS